MKKKLAIVVEKRRNEFENIIAFPKYLTGIGNYLTAFQKYLTGSENY